MMALLYIKRETSLWSRMIAVDLSNRRVKLGIRNLWVIFKPQLSWRSGTIKCEGPSPSRYRIRGFLYDCMKPRPSMWGQKSLFNIRYKIYAFFIQLYVTKGGQILTKGHINFFFKELNILLQRKTRIFLQLEMWI